MKCNLHRLKIYKLNGFHLPKLRRVDEIIFSNDYKINKKTYNVESRISSNIDNYVDTYYARVAISNNLLTGYLRNEKGDNIIETLERKKNDEMNKSKLSDKNQQLYIVYKVTGSKDLKKIKHFSQIGNYWFAIQGWPEVRDSFRKDSEQVINVTVAFVNSLIMNWYCHPELDKVIDFIFYEDSSKQIIYDIYMELCGSVYAPSNFDGRKLLKIKNKAKKKSKNIKDFHGIDGLYVKMIEENDPLKKFLFGFFCIEIIINKTYALKSNRLKMSKKLRSVTKIQLNEVWVDLLLKTFVNIRDKFIINSALIWQGIDSNDYEDFKEMKDIRDNISHGKLDMQSSLPVRKVEVLMSKLVENYHDIKT